MGWRQQSTASKAELSETHSIKFFGIKNVTPKLYTPCMLSFQYEDNCTISEGSSFIKNIWENSFYNEVKLIRDESKEEIQKFRSPSKDSRLQLRSNRGQIQYQSIRIVKLAVQIGKVSRGGERQCWRKCDMKILYL